MLSLPFVLLSLHALAVYSAPPLGRDDAAVLRRETTIHGLTLRREEYHLLQKRDVSICGVPIRDASHSDCTKHYPPNLFKRVRGSTKSKSGSDTENSSQSSSGGRRKGKSASQEDYSYHSSSTEQREDVQYDQEMAQYEDQDAGGYHCDHFTELQTSSYSLNPYCTNPGISAARVTTISKYVNNPNKNLYLVRGDVNSAKGAVTRLAISRQNNPSRPKVYKSKYDQDTWVRLVEYLKAKESVARATAAQIKTDSGLTQRVDTTIYAIYEDTLAISEAMRDSYVPSRQVSQQGSQGGNSPHHSDNSGGTSELSDVQTEEVTYNGRTLTLYWVSGAWHYVYDYNGQGTYIEYNDDNLRQWPPNVQ
ncbi:uncharacterized protein BT62DRAFT_990290 [Guyanagaster necrorhizus]|uniref:Uncharacterized protein n=1 Tax=Guyanagaster necrorhizus TaxID=856835 RepID=A0A9P8AY55_9AGAR|nr:uncharacterized protein BT62DRAFT_990290 [Guyanagaster necrorhizus MCA 3950]KAG7451896.1 hypothetical protein BT62DRAFT_990290 [Guyanagaster necrorhizus MCA 3950]